jgi:hypothetical protein
MSKVQQSINAVKAPVMTRKRNALSKKRLEKLIEKSQEIDSKPKGLVKAEFDFSDLRTEQEKGALLLWVYFNWLF